MSEMNSDQPSRRRRRDTSPESIPVVQPVIETDVQPERMKRRRSAGAAQAPVNGAGTGTAASADAKTSSGATVPAKTAVFKKVSEPLDAPAYERKTVRAGGGQGTLMPAQVNTAGSTGTAVPKQTVIYGKLPVNNTPGNTPGNTGTPALQNTAANGNQAGTTGAAVTGMPVSQKTAVYQKQTVLSGLAGNTGTTAPSVQPDNEKPPVSAGTAGSKRRPSPSGTAAPKNGAAGTAGKPSGAAAPKNGRKEAASKSSGTSSGKKAGGMTGKGKKAPKQKKREEPPVEWDGSPVKLYGGFTAYLFMNFAVMAAGFLIIAPLVALFSFNEPAVAAMFFVFGLFALLLTWLIARRVTDKARGYGITSGVLPALAMDGLIVFFKVLLAMTVILIPIARGIALSDYASGYTPDNDYDDSPKVQVYRENGLGRDYFKVSNDGKRYQDEGGEWHNISELKQ